MSYCHDQRWNSLDLKLIATMCIRSHEGKPFGLKCPGRQVRLMRAILVAQ